MNKVSLVSLDGKATAVLRMGNHAVRVRDMMEAQTEHEKFRDASGLGASEFPMCSLTMNGMVYRVAYNGSVWDGGTKVLA